MMKNKLAYWLIIFLNIPKEKHYNCALYTVNCKLINRD